MENSKDVVVKKLELRRDVVKFILDIRMYREIMTSDNKEKYVNKYKYFDYMRKYNNFFERVDSFIEGAKEGLINLNALSACSDDLFREAHSCFNDGTEDEKVALGKIIDEIEYLSLCCPNITTLCTELMKFHNDYNLPSFLSIQDKVLFSNKIAELLSLTSYKDNSSEKSYLMEHFYQDKWYATYFFKDDAKANNQANFRNLINVVINSNLSCREALAGHIKAGAVLEKDVLLHLIQNSNRSESVRKILSILRAEKISLAFSLDEFISEYFESVKEENEKAQRNKLTNLLLSLLILSDSMDVLAYITKAFVTCHIDDLVMLNVAADLLEAYPNGYHYTTFNYFYGIAKDDFKNDKCELARVLANAKGE